MRRANQLDIDRAFVLVIDIQEKLTPLVQGAKALVGAARKLLDGVRVFKLPVMATEQYPTGLGRTVEPVKSCLDVADATVLEKPTFSAWAHPPVREAILALDRPQVVVVGIETHVCVQQTTLDLISRDYDVFICADAVSSRGQEDHQCALSRMRQEGAFIATVESVLFELCDRCDTPQFKAMLEVIKRTPPADEG